MATWSIDNGKVVISISLPDGTKVSLSKSEAIRIGNDLHKVGLSAPER